MDKDISKKEARKRLEDSVLKVDWITHFLGDDSDQDNFLNVYRGLHAQLREGDKLEIKPSLSVYDGRHGLEVPTADFGIILIEKDGKSNLIYARGTAGGIGSGHLLYVDDSC